MDHVDVLELLTGIMIVFEIFVNMRACYCAISFVLWYGQAKVQREVMHLELIEMQYLKV